MLRGWCPRRHEPYIVGSQAACFEESRVIYRKFLSIDASCQKTVVTLHQKQEHNPKTRATMGVNYSIDCRHCGEHTDYMVATNIYMRPTRVELHQHIDTECAIRCPKCRSRLNSSYEEFRSQVKIEYCD